MAKRQAARPPKPAEPTEYERFEGLTKRLIKVPKSEIDAKREREERQRRNGSKS